jgi:outer membrane protein
MKNFFKLAVVLVATVFSLNASAQAPKFGHIDSNALLLLMPERKTAETNIQSYAKQLEGQLQAMTQEWEGKVADYQKEEKSLSDLMRKTKVKEITDLENRIKDFQQTAQEDLQKKEGELLQPMIDKAKKAIEEVAKENKYTYVFDSSMGLLLYSPESDDIMPLVKKKMNIK